MIIWHTKILILGALVLFAVLSAFILCVFGTATVMAAPAGYCWQSANPGKKCIERAKAECTESGGSWGGIETGHGRLPGCNPKTKDAGKTCNLPEQCEGSCVNGKCSNYLWVKGCGILNRDENGKVHAMCVD